MRKFRVYMILEGVKHYITKPKEDYYWDDNISRSRIMNKIKCNSILIYTHQLNGKYGVEEVKE